MNPNQGRLQGFLFKGDFGTPGASLTSAALKVLEARYLLRDAEGEIIETPLELFQRVARAVSSVEGKWNKKAVDLYGGRFFELLSSLRFLPNSPTLMNAGKPKGQLSACFVLPIDDDLGGVFETLRNAVLIHKTGGGTGFSFGNLRPSTDRIASTGGTASGPIAVLKLFDAATQIVKQGGVRRGANMAILPIDHPQIEEFIHCKSSGGIENFNISVGVSDAFMEAVKAGKSWDLVNPRTRKIVKTVNAKKLWKQISEAAWSSGDPGVVFLDRVNAANPTPQFGPMESTNPCGEQPLLPFESCNLGSLNLVPYVKGDSFDWDQLDQDIRLAVRFLDDIIELNRYPLLEVEEITLMNRKIGLGVMGWADVLMEWGVPYDSPEAIVRASEVMEHIQRIAVDASEELASERGAFPAFSKSLWAKRGSKPRRNATVTTVAPTGTISIIAGVSSGIEPSFSLAYERTALEGESLVFVHPSLKKHLREFYGQKAKKALMQVLSSGSAQMLTKLPMKTRKALRCAPEIHPSWHVKMQAAFQKHTENGVSKTINLPFKAKASDVQKIYELAYDLGCKGITVFRDQSKPTQVLKSGLKIKSKVAQKDLLEAIDWLLDDAETKISNRKKASLGLAALSRSNLKKDGGA